MQNFPINKLINDTRTQVWGWICCIMVWGAILACANPVSAQQTLFIGDLILQEDQWEYWEQERTVLHVEGRYESISGKVLKMQDCDLIFRAGPSVRLENSKTDSRQIRMTGKLVPHGSTYEFKIETFSNLPVLTKQMQDRLKAQENISEVTLYDLARNARDQAEFYQDPDLLILSKELLHQAIDVEQKSFIGVNANGLFKLALKAKRLQASSDVWEPMLHKSLRLKWDQLKDRSNEDQARVELTEQVSKLPGAKIVLPELDPQQEKSYREQALEVYDRSDAFERLTLNRLFYLEVIENSILKGLNVEQSNGAEIAAELAAFIPERIGSQQITDLKMAGLEFKFQHAQSATRSEIIELWQAFQDLKQPEKSKQAMQNWVKNREERIQEEGPALAPQLADDVVKYLKNKQRAIKLLLAAVQQSPDSSDITGRLETLGYIKVEDKWIEEKAYRAKLDNDPIKKAMRQGVVIKGMTLEQVQKTLGTPRQHFQSATRTSITEVWVYPQSEGQFISVYFERKIGDNRKQTEAKTVQQSQ